MVMLLVYSAQMLSSAAQDGLDITRATADKFVKRGQVADGAFLAPSWGILRPALAMAKHSPNRAWDEYVPRYVVEMRASYRIKRAKWDALLARGTVTLCCFCANPERCHRWILRTMILPKCGAVDGGEVRA
jgi:uncharacterized protein YeaO (DUF488 family)